MHWAKLPGAAILLILAIGLALHGQPSAPDRLAPHRTTELWTLQQHKRGFSVC